VEADSATLIRTWLDTFPRETRERCSSSGPFETSGELFGCTLATPGHPDFR
jgi:hypothetical protein